LPRRNLQDAPDLNECANRVIQSQVACRRVLDHLAELARDDRLSDPKWATTVRSLASLVTAVTPRRR
jgi:hypothetical protein